MTIAVNADFPQLPPGPELKAYQYTNLAYYCEAAWDGADASGRKVPAGVCFLRVETAGGASFERLVVAPR